LKIDFLNDDENIVTSEDPATEAGPLSICGFGPECETQADGAPKSVEFLTSLHEVRADGSVSAANLVKDSKQLQWAGGSKAS
jgi:hypothetical protein